MSITYTVNAGLGIPAFGDDPWVPTLQADIAALDAMSTVTGLIVTTNESPASTSLDVKVAAGSYPKADGTYGTYAGVAPFLLAASSTTSLYLTDSGVLTASVSGFPAATNIVRLAVITTSGSVVTGITDARVGPCSWGNLKATFLNLAAGGIVANTFTVNTGGGSTVFTVVPGSLAIGFFGSVPATQASSLAALTDSTTGTAGATVNDVTGSFSQTILNNNFASLIAKVTALTAAIKRHGLMAP